MKTYTFHVQGMHCASCPVLIKSELEDISEVSSAKASLSLQNVEVVGEFGDKTHEHIARDLSEVIRRHGYTLSVDHHRHVVRWSEFAYALPSAGIFIALFILLQKLGVVNLLSGGTVTYGTAFVVGLVASVSTCMAVVGGLVLSMSASFAKEGERVRPQLLFHVGRLIAFFFLGGVIGLAGSFFTLGVTGTFVLSLLVALVLLTLGVNLLDVLPWLKRIQPTLPGSFGKRIHRIKEGAHGATPFLVGVATFFLPCGFTQSMQIYTLTTGSFVTGAVTMFSFALGTLPVLALLSFSSFAVRDKKQSGIFFKTAGLVVIFFGLLNLITSLVAVGVIPPLFNF